VSDNEAESTFITSPKRVSVSAVRSSRQRRRAVTVTESSSIRHAAETAVVEDIHSPTGDKSSSPVSSVSIENAETGNRRMQLVPVSKVTAVNFKVISSNLLMPLLLTWSFEEVIY
jgi:hypothetical protein